MRIRLSVIAVAALTVLSAGCTPNEEGRPQPVRTLDASPSSVSPGGSPAGFGDLKSCDLLDKALEGQGYPASEADNVGSSNGCSTNKFGSAMSLNLDDKQGVDDLAADPSKAYDGKINGRRIRQVKEIDGSEATCLVLLEVSAKARAMVSVTLGTQGSTNQACDDAFSVAQAVEPQLPKA
ncbi:DUF3558 family protein [Saccharothrix sp. AJ9571]|nr:DUF3558 family protein [Saccharothrix sp. AJ9571]